MPCSQGSCGIYKWNLQTHNLQAHYIPEDHTSVQLQDAFKCTTKAMGS